MHVQDKIEQNMWCEEYPLYLRSFHMYECVWLINTVRICLGSNIAYDKKWCFCPLDRDPTVGNTLQYFIFTNQNTPGPLTNCRAEMISSWSLFFWLLDPLNLFQETAPKLIIRITRKRKKKRWSKSELSLKL